MQPPVPRDANAMHLQASPRVLHSSTAEEALQHAARTPLLRQAAD